MSTFTVSPCLFDCADQPETLRVFYSFVTENGMKLALDNKGLALDKYNSLIETKKLHMLSSWLDLISNMNKFSSVKINPNIAEKNLFLEICSKTFGAQILLVGTRQNFVDFNQLSEMSISYNGVEIELFESCDILQYLEKPKMVIHRVENSSITGNGDVIND